MISKVGDVFLSAVRDFESVYPAYIARIPMNEKLIKDEMEINAEFRRFIEVCFIFIYLYWILMFFCRSVSGSLRIRINSISSIS